MPLYHSRCACSGKVFVFCPKLAVVGGKLAPKATLTVPGPKHVNSKRETNVVSAECRVLAAGCKQRAWVAYSELHHLNASRRPC